jgi:hypothetical protein
VSPQLNGEPRADRLTTAEAATDPILPSLGSYDPDPPLPPEINTDRLSKTVITGDVKLAPLFTQHATADFRSRWDIVQRSFVDDPREAVHAADELVAQVTKALTETFAQQRSTLEQSFDQSQAPSTENLRVALRQYRAFFERLLSL